MSATIAFHPVLFFNRLFNRLRAICALDILTVAAGFLFALWLASAFPHLIGTAQASQARVPAGFSVEVPDNSIPLASETLAPRMENAMEQVSRRYRVSTDALKPVFQAAQAAGRTLNLDPLLIIAVIGTESGFNPFSESVMGAQGLMQVIPRFHPEKIPDGAGEAVLFNPVINVQVGAKVLEESIRRNGGLMNGLQQFAGASDDPEQRYANKVIAEKQRLERGLSRRS